MVRSGSIPKEQIERIREATDIVQLIGGYVVLKSSGQNFMGLCPFHSEKTPSFVVSPARQNYHCYGCGVHGDSIRFLMEMENFQFIEAIRYLAERAGILLQEKSVNTRKNQLQNDLQTCLNVSFDFFRSNLLNSQENSVIKNYLRERMIPPDLIESFQLGYVPEGWTNLHDALNYRKITIEIQENAGLIKKGDRGGYYDRLRNRLIFPIRDNQGRLLGFAGRVLGNEEPKYLNPPETELYKKSSSFYGVFQAKNDIRKQRRAILVEGYLDVIRLHEKGWKEAIAACGTALNENHIAKLKRLGIPEVILLFDGDKAGVKAAEKAAALFVKNNLDSRVVVLPDGLDPDDYFKEYEPADFEKLLTDASTDLDFLIERTLPTLANQGLEAQKKVLQEFSNLIDGVTDSIKRDLMLSKLSKAFNVEKRNLFHKLSTNIEKNVETSVSYANIAVRDLPDPKLPDSRFLQYLMVQVRSIIRARQFISAEDFSHPVLANLYSRFLQLSDEEFQSLTPHEIPELFVEHSSVIMHLLQTGKESLTSAYSEQILDQMMYALKKQKITLAHRQVGLTEDQRRDLLVRTQEIRREFSHLNHRKFQNESKNQKG